MLTQGQYHPMSTADQVIVVYTGTRGHLDDLPVSEVEAFEVGLIKYITEEHINFLGSIL